MAYFNNKEIRFKPRPIPSTPSVFPPDVPEPQPTTPGSTPTVHPTFTGDTTIHLYVIEDQRNKINKTLNNEITLNIRFEDTSTINPVFLINTNTDLSFYNYMYIEQTQRYYFIDNVELYNDNMYKIYGVSDVLMSFKNYILETVGIVDVTEKDSIINKNLPDSHYINSSGKNIKILECKPSEESKIQGFESNPHRILVVCGKTENVTPGGQ